MTTQHARKLPIWWILGGIAAVALIATVLLTMSGGEDFEFGSPTVSGDALPTLVDPAADPAVGAPIPVVAGSDFDGAGVSLAADGRAKIILFLAHWCSHCQAEVPVVQEWLDGGGLPDGVDFYSVATSISETRENYPPDAWLEREGWTPPVVVDDEASTIGVSYGLNAFPYWVFVYPDGTVAGRTTGQLPADVLDQIAAELSAG
jgi:thiol-disulfide isomerase/thioredoxin